MKIRRSRNKTNKKNVFIQSLKKYCQQSSLHGWQYLSSEEGIIKKLIWFMVIIVHYALASYFVWNNCNQFTKAKPITTIESTTSSLDDIDFPTVTVCNLNTVRKSFLREIGVEEKKIKLVLEEFATGRKTNSTSNQDQESVEDVTRKFEKYYKDYEERSGYHVGHIFHASHQPCRDMIVKVNWSDKPSESFYDSMTIQTEYGNCCWIPPYLYFEDDRENLEEMTTQEWLSIPKGFASNGLQNGLTLTMDLEKFDHSVIWDSIGFVVGLSQPNTVALMKNEGINVSPGFLSKIAVMPVTTSTTQEAIDNFDPIDRNCYTDSEVELKYTPREHGYRYSLQNCMLSAMLDKLIKECQCLTHMNYEETQKWNPDLKSCKGPTELACANSIMSKIGSIKLGLNATDINNVTVPCLERCDSQENNIFMSQLIYPHKKHFQNHEDLCLIMEKIAKICSDPHRKEVFEKHYKNDPTCQEFIDYYLAKNETCGNEISLDIGGEDEKFEKFYLRYAEENLSKIAVYLKNPYHTSIIKDVKITLTDFVSNTGGLMGLYLGLSFISVFELIYHFIKYFSNSY